LVRRRRAREGASGIALVSAHEWEAELAMLQIDLTEIATELYRDRHDRAINEAVLEKMDPNMVLH
jgi:hypothetical protein